MPYLTGFLGLMPLDQSIIFEAGGRIAKGEVSFRDFYLPYGLVPSLMQAVFFKLLGVNWFAYVTHAALINGCFALVLFDGLVLLLPATKPSKLLPGTLLTAWAFYPMTGTPFLENHSLFFTLLAYWCLLAAFTRKKVFLLLFCFPCMVVAFYSKPIPVMLWIPPVLFECWVNRKRFSIFLPSLSGGLLVACLLMLLPALLFPVAAFQYYTFILPFNLGRGRLENSFASRFLYAGKYFKMLLITMVPMLLYLTAYMKTAGKEVVMVIRCLLITGVTVLFGVLTKNAFYNVTTPVFIITFIIFHSILLNEVSNVKLVAVYRRFNFLLWGILIAGVSLLNFRRTIDINFRVRDLKNFSGELGFFVKTPLGKYSADDIEKLKSIIDNNRVLYTGDMQFLFSLSGRANPLPLTHINDRTTYNSSDSVHYIPLKRQLVNNLLLNKTHLLIEDESVYNPKQDLVAYIHQISGRQLDAFASIKVYMIDTAALYQLASSLNIRRDK